MMKRTSMPLRQFSCLLRACVAIGLMVGAAAAEDIAPFFGVTGHFLHTNRFYREQPAYWQNSGTLPFVREMGLHTVHEALYAWTSPGRAVVSNGTSDPIVLRAVETNRRDVSDELSRYDQAGMKVIAAVIGIAPGSLAIENNTEFAAWVADLAAAHPSIVGIQLHNEPNLRSFWRGTPEEYVRTFRPFADAIHAKRPDVRIYGGAISSLWWPQGIAWLKKAVDAGLLDFVDGIAMHPYTTTLPPEVDPHFKGAPPSDPDQREKALHAFWDTLSGWNRTKRPLDLIFTEFGYSTGKGLAEVADESTQADYLSRSLLIYMDAKLTGVPIRSVYWYDLKDDGPKDENLQHRFGLISYDLSRKKPAFDAYKAVATAFSDVGAFEPASQPARTSAPDVKLKTWRRKADGARIVAFWSTASGGRAAQADIAIEIPGVRAGKARLQSADARPESDLALQANADGRLRPFVPRPAHNGWSSQRDKLTD